MIRDKIEEICRTLNNEKISKNAATVLAKEIYEKFDENKFIYLCALMHKYCKIEYRCNEAMIDGNRAFMDAEDFYSVFISLMYESIYDYDYETTGTFQGYVHLRLLYTFAEYKKCAYFRVTGNIPIEKRGSETRKTICGNFIFDKLGTNYADDYENTNLKDYIYKCINKLPELYRKIIIYMYFEGEKRSIKETAEHFNIKYNTMRLYVSQAYSLLRKFGIPTVKDYVETSENTNLFEFRENDYDKYLKFISLDEYSYIPIEYCSNYQIYAFDRMPSHCF